MPIIRKNMFEYKCIKIRTETYPEFTKTSLNIVNNELIYNQDLYKQIVISIKF